MAHLTKRDIHLVEQFRNASIPNDGERRTWERLEKRLNNLLAKMRDMVGE